MDKNNSELETPAKRPNLLQVKDVLEEKLIETKRKVEIRDNGYWSNGERLRGITCKIEQEFDRLFRMTGGVAENRSSKRTNSSVCEGTKFHQKIYHELFCKPPYRCSCLEVTGSKPVRSTKKTTKISCWVSGVKNVLRTKGITPIQGEYIVSQENICTQIDLLGVYISTGEVVNVSYKTGYSKTILRSHSEISNECTVTDSQVFSLADTSPLKLWAYKHRMQQYVENFLLFLHTGLNISHNLIIYAGISKDSECCLPIGHSTQKQLLGIDVETLVLS